MSKHALNEEEYIRSRLTKANLCWLRAMDKLDTGVVDREEIIRAMDALNGAIKHCMEKNKMHLLKEFNL